jgi:phosphohistidine phosphatase
MKRLILVRHATAEDKGLKGSDFHRRLRKRGKREAQLMADRVAAEVGVPDQFFSSPADRALETARLFAERLGVPAERVTVREELYGGLEPDDFLHLVQRFDNRVKNVMVFGHDPSFTEFAAFMIPDFNQSIPKAGVLVMDIQRSRWQSVRAGEARMALFERPPALDEQKRMHEDLMDRLVVAIRSGILSGVRDFGLGSSREVTRAIARTSARLARDLSEFARMQDSKRSATARKSSPAHENRPATKRKKRAGTRRRPA